MNRRFLITSAPGLENLLADELRELGLDPVVEPSRAVTLEGDWDTAARVLIRSRIAGRVYVSLRRFSARTKAMLYDQVRRIPWPEVFPNRLTFAVHASGTTQGTDYVISYAPLKIKDAVCDEFRKRNHDRPDVGRQDPDVRLQAFFYQGRCELSMDLAGRPLHRRGYRADGAEAPLRENRAAALLRFNGYDGSRPLVDPFCGSGTIPIEAWLMATRTAPGLLRTPDAYTLATLFPEAVAVLEAEHATAGAERLDAPPHPIRGSDTSAGAVATARANSALAGAAGGIEFTETDALTLESPDSWVVFNPPYGERLENPAAAGDLLRAFATRVKHHAAGSTMGLVIPRGDLEKCIGLKPQKRLAVESGQLGLRYLSFNIFSGRFHEARS